MARQPRKNLNIFIKNKRKFSDYSQAKEMNKIKFTLWLVTCSISLIMFSCNYFENDGRKVVGKENFKGIENLYLIGVVDSVQQVINKLEGYHGRGIIRISIIKSNVGEYDPRNEQANYYCIIKNRKAEIYEHSGGLKIGDTIILDIKSKKIVYKFVNGEVGGLRNIWISPKSFFNFIEEKGYQKL